jgi:hypothetical protein
METDALLLGRQADELSPDKVGRVCAAEHNISATGSETFGVTRISRDSDDQ